MNPCEICYETVDCPYSCRYCALVNAIASHLYEATPGTARTVERI